MLELSISTKEIFCISLLILATYANITRDVRSAILGILSTVMLLVFFISAENNSIFAITLGIIYISILSLFFTIAQDTNLPKLNRTKCLCFSSVTLVPIALMILFTNPEFQHIKMHINTTIIEDLSMLICILCSIVISFLSSLFQPK